jgi:putative Mg2+ transporter-C (MgtC) family protein
VNWSNILHLAISYLLALPAGWERERHERSAGLRTYTLISVASCGFVLIAREALVDANAQARIIQGLIGGIGFIGAGTILRGKGAVHGTATAASILVTGIIGTAVAYRMYDMAVVLSAISLFTLRTFSRWKDSGFDEDRR